MQSRKRASTRVQTVYTIAYKNTGKKAKKAKRARWKKVLERILDSPAPRAGARAGLLGGVSLDSASLSLAYGFKALAFNLRPPAPQVKVTVKYAFYNI